MRIGFLNNQIDERGTTWATCLYAKYVHDLLGHEVVVLYPNVRYGYHLQHSWLGRTTRQINSLFSAKQRAKLKAHYDVKMADKIRQHGLELAETKLDADFSDFDAIYHLKSGNDDKFRPKGTLYWVHAVFDTSQPHGDRYATVSRWLGYEHNLPSVPAVIDRPNDLEDNRKALGIPSDAIVFGRYGARNSFDIPWVWDAIADSLAKWKNVYFMFANTDVKMSHERILNIPTMYETDELSLEIQKRRFINTCDAMLHARQRGETFGTSTGEFAVCGKPILTYADSPERSHFDMLSNPIAYKDTDDLKSIIGRIVGGEKMIETGGEYLNCTPEKVVKTFEQVFIK